MTNIEFLPLGSIVVVKGAIRKTMIIARGIAARMGEETNYFDYAGCIYPEGLMGDQLLYFNHEDIAKEVFQGFSDEDNLMMVENMKEWLKTNPYPKGNPYELNQKRKES